MKIPILNTDTIEQLRGFFHPKDRSVILADDTFIEGEEVTTPANPRHNRGRLYWKNRCWTQLDEFGNETAFCSSWQDWTPTVTQSVAVTATVTYARYVVWGNTVHLLARLAITSAGTAGNAVVIAGLPAAIVPNLTASATAIVGTGIILDTGTSYYVGGLVWSGGNSFRIQSDGVANYVGITPNFALANGDFLGLHATYERS